MTEKNIKAIVYTSNAGSTEQFAKMAGEQLNLPVYSLKEAKKNLKKGSAVIYLGWVMAAEIKGYKKAVQLFEVPAVGAVGMAKGESTKTQVAQKNQISEDTALFMLQGGFNLEKLHGIYKLMMKLMVKGTIENLEYKKDKTPEEEDMLDLMKNGGSRISVEQLEKLINWYKK